MAYWRADTFPHALTDSAKGKQMDNLMLAGAQDQYEAGLRAAEEATEQAAVEADEDIDGFSNFIADIGAYQKPVTLPCIRSDRDSIERWADAATPQQLIAGLMSPVSEVRSMAATYLRNLWLDSRDDAGKTAPLFGDLSAPSVRGQA